MRQFSPLWGALCRTLPHRRNALTPRNVGSRADRAAGPGTGHRDFSPQNCRLDAACRLDLCEKPRSLCPRSSFGGKTNCRVPGEICYWPTDSPGSSLTLRALPSAPQYSSVRVRSHRFRRRGLEAANEMTVGPVSRGLSWVPGFAFLPASASSSSRSQIPAILKEREAGCRSKRSGSDPVTVNCPCLHSAPCGTSGDLTLPFKPA